MKIRTLGDSVHLNKTVPTDRKTKTHRKQEPSAEDVAKVKKDQVVISEEAKSKISRYVEIVKNMPDVRPEVIERVKKKLAQGAYNTKETFEETAEKIIEDLKK